jgi:outer membrane protein assembly factor BamE (lipoprotein component of BamABCDE complex)
MYVAGKKVKVAKKSDVKKRSAKVAPVSSGADENASSRPSKESGADAKALWAKVGSGGR